jgi:hypothetical protein
LLCGTPSLVILGCLGLCLDGFLTCLPIGGLLEGGVLWFGRWCVLTSFSVYGGKGTIGALSTWRGHWRTLYPLSFFFFFHMLYLWTTMFVSHLLISYDDFFSLLFPF